MKLLGFLGTALAALVLVLVVREARRPEISRLTAATEGTSRPAALAESTADAQVVLEEGEPAEKRREHVARTVESPPEPANAARLGRLRIVDKDELPIADARVTDVVA